MLGTHLSSILLGLSLFGHLCTGEDTGEGGGENSSENSSEESSEEVTLGDWSVCVQDANGDYSRNRSCTPTDLCDQDSTLDLEQDCQLAAWSVWTVCSGNDTDSVRRRTNCSAVSSFFHCETGVDNLEKRDCTVPGSWGSWTDWSTCSTADGTRQRTRQCDRWPTVSNQETRPHVCEGVSQEAEDCSAYHLHCATSGLLESNNYDNNLDDSQTIIGPKNSQLDLTIKATGIEFGMNCEFDYLQVFEKKTGKDLLGKICGTTERRIHINSNEVDVIFHSDDNIGGSGWTIDWCAPQIVSSPGWPNVYDNNIDTSDKITVDEGKKIKLEFIAFDIEGSGTEGVCPYDWVRIVDGDGSEILGKTCGNDLQTGTPDSPLYSNTNVVYVNFHSDNFARRNGFMLHWVQRNA